MPWKSEAQRRWGNSPEGIKALGQKTVDEFNRATDEANRKLPDHVGTKGVFKRKGR